MVLDRSEMRNCPECDVQLKVKNLPRHFKRIHGIEIGNSTVDIERALKRKNNGTLSKFRSSPRIQIAFSIIVVLILSLSIYYGMIYEGSFSDYGFQRANIFPIILDDDGMEEHHKQVKIPVSYISHKAKFYYYDSNGTKIRVFAVLGSDEKPRVAFDASENSYQEKKGFRQDGDKMVDNAGNMEFDIDTIGSLTLDNKFAPALLTWDYCCEKKNVAINITDLNTQRDLFK